MFKSMKDRLAMVRGSGQPGWQSWLRLMAACALVAVVPAVWAQAAPVLAGAWEVRSLITYSPAGTPPVARRYRICIGPDRSRSPMMPRNPAPATELVFDKQGYNGFAAKVTDTDGSQPQLEFSYRRLSARAFEGTHDLSQAERAARLQYFAQYVGPDCGATSPSWPRDSGEP